ncbi:MAG: ABC transporter permease [Clostridium sp.]|nr:ABC transporter permease [Clostridium sp.]
MEGKLQSSSKIQENASKEVILSPGKIAWKKFRHNKIAMVGLVLLIIIILISIFGPMLSPYKMDDIDLENTSSPPTITHLLGTDENGRDELVRVMYAGRISLAVGFFAVVVEVLIGCVLGVASGYYGGIVDSIIMRLVDIFSCLPTLPILMMIGAIMLDLKVNPSSKMYVLMVVIGILSWPQLCRLVRGEILSLREKEYMQAAEALGLRDRRKMFKHLLPNTLATIIVTAALGVAGAILTESALSFLGLGVTVPTPSWGALIQSVDDMQTLQNYPWLWIPAGTCILLTVVSINLIGDGLRDALDPKHNN